MAKNRKTIPPTLLRHSASQRREYEFVTNSRITNSSAFLKNRTAYFVIFVFAFLLYANTLGHGFVMDDGAVVTEHATVQKGFAGITELFGQSSVYGSTKENFGTYRPLTMSLFAVEKQLFGNSPSAFHFIQVLLYSILCVVIYILLQKLLKNHDPLLPLISVLIFAAHPLHTEVAANIKSADEVLSMLFCMLATLFTLRFAETSNMKFAAASFFFFLCALFSKESSATFLVIIQLAVFIFGNANKKQVLTVLGLHLTALALYFLARNAALDPNPPQIGMVNNTLASATSFGDRYATIFVVLFHYLKLLVFPHPLCWDYGYNQVPVVGWGDVTAIVSLLSYLAMGVYAIVMLIKVGSRQSAVGSLAAFCILFFLIALSVSSNIFVLIGSTMAERFLFTPSLGFCILIAYAAIKVLKIDLSTIRRPASVIRLVPLGILLLLYSYKTFSRNKDWESNLTLFRTGVRDCPNSYRTNTTFAWESVKAGEKETDPEKKKMHFLNAVEHYRKGMAIYDIVAADWYNYGVTNSYLGNAEETINQYLRAVQLDPGHTNALYNLSTIYLSRKDFPNALKYFTQLYGSQPDFMDVSFKIGVIHHMGGNPKEAIPYYERYYKNNPGNKDVVNNLEIAYRAVGDTEKEKYFSAIRLKNATP